MKVLGLHLMCALVWLTSCGSGGPTKPVDVGYEEGLTGFAARLDSLRVNLRIPGMSAVVARDGAVVWARGFGLADVERGRRTQISTPFHLASLTKPFAATVLMQLVEAGLVDLDDPVSKYGVTLSGPGVIRVRHLLTHTSEGVPGSQYHYSGNRFAYLDQVIEAAAGRSFGELLVERILRPLGVRNTAPNPKDARAFDLTGLDRRLFMAEMAAGYELRGSDVVAREHPDYFGVSAGLVASAEDVAKFSLGIDEGRFLSASTWAQVFTPARSTTGRVLPYGLGWFIHTYPDYTLQWHYGQWTTNSSLIVRVPERKLTFVFLANTPQMSAAYGLGGDSDVLRSAVARLFYEWYALGDTLR